MYTHMYVCMYVCKYAYLSLSQYIYICIYIYICSEPLGVLAHAAAVHVAENHHLRVV